MNRWRSWKWTAFALTAIAGCSLLEPGPDPTRFFVLHSIAPAGGGNPAAAAAVEIGVGPVRLPDYLRRPQVVRRVGESRVELSEFDRWAEPLDTAVPRVVAENLRSRIPGAVVFTYPWPVGSVRYEVQIDVLQFEANAQGGAELVARWSLRDGKKRTVLAGRETQLRHPAADSTTEAAVSAMSEALAELSNVIAAELARLQ